MEPAASEKSQNPFPGLRPFLPEENHLFFGREQEMDEVLKKLLQNRFVAVIGTAGSGKSSLVSAGIIPEIINQGRNTENEWKYISVCPGNTPLENLKNAFAQAVSANTNIKENGTGIITGIENNPDWLVKLVKDVLAGTGERILLVIDQFEELFTCSTSQADPAIDESVAEFTRLIESAVNQTSADIYVILAIRTDFVGECAHLSGLTQLINSSNYLLPRMKRESLKAVIEKPLKAAGIGFDPDLTATILEDLGNRADSLPLLEHALMRTYSSWERRGDRNSMIGLSDYSAAGKISGAMALQANEAYEQLSPRGKEICRGFFKAITVMGPDNKGIRRPTRLGTIKSVTECNGEELLEVIEKFRVPSVTFLKPDSGIRLNDNTVIDITHEALIHQWDRLKEWVREEAYDAGIYKNLSEASALFQQGKAALLKNPDLEIAVNWRDKRKPSLHWAERYDPAFERAMVYLRTSEKANKDEQTERQKKQVNKSKGRIISFFLGGLSVISVGLMLFAFIQKMASDMKRIEAEQQKTEAVQKADRVARNSEAVIHKLAEADSAAAVASLKVSEAIRLKEMSDNERNIAERLTSESLKRQTEAVREADSAKSSQLRAELIANYATEEKNAAMRGRLIAIGKSMSLRSLQLPGQQDLQSLLAYQGYLFNLENGGAQNDADIYTGLYNVAKLYGDINYKSFYGHEGGIESVAFIPGKREFITSGSDGKLMKWSLDRPSQSLQLIYSGTEIINVLAVSPDGGWLACGERSSKIRMIPLSGSDQGYDLKGHSGEIKSLIFSFDGKYLYSSSLDGKVLKWDIKLRSSTDISGNILQVTSIDLSSDNKYIAGVGKDGKVKVWDPDLNSDNFTIGSAGRTISRVRFKPDENILALGYTDGYIEIWDIAAREKISEFQAHNDEIRDIRFNSQISQLATASFDGTIKLWDTKDTGALPVIFNDNEGLVVEMAFSHDGQVIISGTSGSKNNLTGRGSNAGLLAAGICSKVTRNFTGEEWMSYAGKDIPYEKTCPDKEYKIKVREVR